MGRQPLWFIQISQLNQTNTISTTWPSLNLPSTNTFINTIDLLSTSFLSNPSSFLQISYTNNQQIYLSHQINPTQLNIYKVTNSTPGLISLTSSILPSLPTFYSFKLPYNQLKFYDNQLQIDYQEILALIHINNHSLVPTTLPPQL
ncbi:5130_t:CDS:2 [Ambispora leptoticha]|uniref:5130_t:CDS:1 n=1 Tax=Ambispora leptoticha TaxID=144679 RepID=A0A9N9FXW6_9GLOM|nr:5130_t:CDS:2 [Ambispora leptoticha]